MSYKFLNNVIGWLMLVVSFAVYMLTLEPSVSFWDCGEFISASFKLQVVHPPGAPFFLLLGRLFSLMASEPSGVGMAVNTLSALASAFTVMFTFWITTYFAKKMLANGEQPSGGKLITIFGAGIIAALALTFSDSFWFSAVEAEVYALSSFFTALTFWAMLKWEADNSTRADKWIVLISYLTGMAVGTHLLNLLVIPAVVYIYYFKNYKPDRKGIIAAGVIALVILFSILKGIIPGIPKLMAYFDLFFVNSLSFFPGSGVLFSIVLILGTVAYFVYWSHKNNRRNLNFALVCLTYILLGYSSYAMVIIRSHADTPIDMNNPEDPFNFVSYINREQYGDRPLLYGPHFNAKMGSFSYEPTGKTYNLIDGKYEVTGSKYEPKFDKRYMTFLPRMGDLQKESGEIGYRYWSGMGDVQNRIDALEQNLRNDPQNESMQMELQSLKTKLPSFGNNLRFMFSYQFGYMYWRYFMWNFVGRQSEEQGHSYKRDFEGNWISGIKPIDEFRLGSQTNLPDERAQNKGRNTYYFLPLILGILGAVVHFKKAKFDAIVVGVLFVFTGLLIVFYLNQPPFEPRERDYSMVGSFQTFCIWIGLGIVFLAEKLSKKTSWVVAGVGSTAVSLFAVPILMGTENWDDHDRSKRYLAIDFAKNYLMSCDSNAILFTNGDNDTYPLWYAQNVEGFRTDVRIINLSLLPTDWYSSILLDKVYSSDPLPLSLTKKDLQAGVNEYFPVYTNSGVNPNIPQPLKSVVRFMLTDDNQYKVQMQDGSFSNYVPTLNFKLPVDRDAIIRNKVVEPENYDRILPEVTFTVPGGTKHKGDLVVMDLLATNAERGWERPIYFTTTTGRGSYMGLEKYFQLEGLTYRLVPLSGRVENGESLRNADSTLYENLMVHFKWGGMKEKKNFFLDDHSKLVPSNLQTVFVRFARDMYKKAQYAQTEIASNGELIQKAREIGSKEKELDMLARNERLNKMIPIYKQKAKALLDKCFEEIPESVLPMRNQTKLEASRLYYDLGEKETSKRMLKELYDKNLKSANYYNSLEKERRGGTIAEQYWQESVQVLVYCADFAREFGFKELSDEFEKEAAQYRAMMQQ